MEPSSPPEILPVFPLTGSLLLPGNFLPLNVFEPRYRAMVEDAMAADRWLGMIQPRIPDADNPGPTPGRQAPVLYRVGCAGWIRECEPQPDGRFLILLRGVQRFQVRSELAPRRGYRRVAADYDEFAGDLAAGAEQLDPGRVLDAVTRFAERRGLEFDHDLLHSLPPLSLVNGLAAALPFLPGEKQALLEARTLLERQEVLVELMGMGMGPLRPEDYYSPPTVN